MRTISILLDGVTVEATPQNATLWYEGAKLRRVSGNNWTRDIPITREEPAKKYERPTPSSPTLSPTPQLKAVIAAGAGMCVRVSEEVVAVSSSAETVAVIDNRKVRRERTANRSSAAPAEKRPEKVWVWSTPEMFMGMWMYLCDDDTHGYAIEDWSHSLRKYVLEKRDGLWFIDQKQSRKERRSMVMVAPTYADGTPACEPFVKVYS